MAVEYHINERDELITLTATGAVTGSEARACISGLLNDAAFDPALPQLVDLRTAEPSGAPEELADFEAYLLGDYRPQLSALVAIVVNPDWNEAECAKAFWISCALGHAELFDAWNQACKWLIQRDFSADGSADKNVAEMADLNAIELSDTEKPQSASDPVTPQS